MYRKVLVGYDGSEQAEDALAFGKQLADNCGPMAEARAIHVRLLWGPDDGRVAVTVADTRTGDRFAFDVPERDRALRAFRHPFAYAAWHGIDPSSSFGTVAALG
jgi:nucleotide-binding universal stress UspA family protein